MEHKIEEVIQSIEENVHYKTDSSGSRFGWEDKNGVNTSDYVT